MKRILAAALLAALATPAHSEEPPPPMQPRSSEAPASEDHGPMWIATTKAKCGPYQVVLWTGVATDDKPAPAPYWRIYHENLSPKAKALLAKRFKEVDGELYLDGKKCTVDTPAAETTQAAAAKAIPAEYECGGYRSVPPEAVERDPVVKTSVSMPSFGVTHTTLTGEVYQREDQYRDIRIWSDRKGDYWSGVSIKNPRRTMVGQLAYDDSRGVNVRLYIEKSFVNRHLERTTTSTCVEVD
jgi:hypothetical protein